MRLLVPGTSSPFFDTAIDAPVCPHPPAQPRHGASRRDRAGPPACPRAHAAWGTQGCVAARRGAQGMVRRGPRGRLGITSWMSSLITSPPRPRIAGTMWSAPAPPRRVTNAPPHATHRTEQTAPCSTSACVEAPCSWDALAASSFDGAIAAG
jgi:hypothetical protein